ncbi:hypothetical protein J2T09_003304 [Neorhizobium huautlense]|uniref:Uncharacterized protein n=1 Tax=Neorhizobium huautlense TaxID=67774 RepID=A0ABT9PWL4_9HYPH|nr:hypothetical protein [Neorhizobium huautlense]MDP9838536.1 hypothetical protein [Neorhizobium huautlense]
MGPKIETDFGRQDRQILKSYSAVDASFMTHGNANGGNLLGSHIYHPITRWQPGEPIHFQPFEINR